MDVAARELAADNLKAKESEVKMLRLELSVERQMLGRIEREAVDKVEAERAVYEAEMKEMKEAVRQMRKERVIEQYQEVLRIGAEMQADISAQREVIRRLRLLS